MFKKNNSEIAKRKQEVIRQFDLIKGRLTTA